MRSAEEWASHFGSFSFEDRVSFVEQIQAEARALGRYEGMTRRRRLCNQPKVLKELSILILKFTATWRVGAMQKKQSSPLATIQRRRSDMREPFGETTMGVMLGTAAIILAICLGIGGCCRIGNVKSVEVEPKVSK